MSHTNSFARVDGLRSASHLNGRMCYVQTYFSGKGRYAAAFADLDDVSLLKPENLVETLQPDKKVCPFCLRGDLYSILVDCGYCRKTASERISKLRELDPGCDFFKFGEKHKGFPTSSSKGDPAGSRS